MIKILIALVVGEKVIEELNNFFVGIGWFISIRVRQEGKNK